MCFVLICHLHHKLIGFYNRDKKCLQRGTDWVFKKAVCALSVKGETDSLPNLAQIHISKIPQRYCLRYLRFRGDVFED